MKKMELKKTLVYDDYNSRIRGGAEGDIGTLYTTMRNALRGGWKLIEVYEDEDNPVR